MDIQNEYGQTDNVIDLFEEIDKAFNKYTCRTEQNRTEQNRTEQNRTEQNSVADYSVECQGENVFDSMTSDDLLIAFFPCIYFETIQILDFALQRNGTTDRPLYSRIEYTLDRLQKRTRLHELLYKLTAICDIKGLRLIIENPATKPNYLISGQNYPPPTIIDNNRMERGDYFRKPTAYWFWNCKTESGFTYQNDKEAKVITKCERSNGDGLCGGERSLMSPDYARNFICDFILGKKQDLSDIVSEDKKFYFQPSLF
jgi:hypothetical protein